ncbi:phosphatase PAP2 family protein [Agromyces intestinalis]|uniref:Phosphatase PAP2 family protein n=1 Tax=Agromyces intestinalis TaxID=2592652 RepID=A0A5C1YDL5_9MICO|nr:phosphatase PAP2 family protein [Agromyces intestinalis]QEO13728.1 phosphatase PAP2 family protein [Agromyces intestinalis]
MSREMRESRVRRFRRRVPIAVGLTAIVLAFGLGALIMLRGGGLPMPIDEEWAEEVLTIRGPVGDVLAGFMNWLGGGIVGVILIPAGSAILLVVLGRPWAALYFVLASVVSAAIVQLLKELFGRDRPEDMLVTSDFGSFPSGHVANAATIAVVVGVIMPRARVWAAGVAYTVLMAVSRTYLGVHWVTDTIGGALVGAGAALLVWAVFAGPLERERLGRIERMSRRNAERAQANVTPPTGRTRP